MIKSLTYVKMIISTFLRKKTHPLQPLYLGMVPVKVVKVTKDNKQMN